MFENPRRSRQARNFKTNVPKIVDLKSSSQQIFSENWRWVPLWCTSQFSGQTSPNWYGSDPPHYKLFHNELYASRYLYARRHVYNATVNINLKNLILVFYSGLSIKLAENHSSDLTKRRHSLQKINEKSDIPFPIWLQKRLFNSTTCQWNCRKAICRYSIYSCAKIYRIFESFHIVSH